MEFPSLPHCEVLGIWVSMETLCSSVGTHLSTMQLPVLWHWHHSANQGTTPTPTPGPVQPLDTPIPRSFLPVFPGPVPVLEV